MSIQTSSPPATPPGAPGVSPWALLATALICLMAGIWIGATLMAPRPPIQMVALNDLPPDHPSLTDKATPNSAPPLSDASAGPATEAPVNPSPAVLNFDSPAVRAQIAAAHTGAELVRIGNREYDRGHARLAAAAYERALARGARSPDVLTDLGTMYRALHRTDDAIRMFREAAAMDPLHANSRFNLGTALFDKGDVAGGLAAWREYLKLAPNGRKAAIVRQHLAEVALPPSVAQPAAP